MIIIVFVMIPRILHFCYFGLNSDDGVFPLIYYIAIRSAIDCIKPKIVYFHNTLEPTGKYWEAIKSCVRRIQCEPPQEIYGRPLLHYAHQADVYRLQILIKTGGIYLDMDTICRRSFDGLLHHPCVMGIQEYPHGEIGLCNAVILAMAQNTFLEEWLGSYCSFRSAGRDRYWDEHSVRIPAKLANISKHYMSVRSDLHIEPVKSFFRPGWWSSEQKRLFVQTEEFPDAYCHHLCGNMSYNKYLKTLTPQHIREFDTTYNLAARQFLSNAL